MAGISFKEFDKAIGEAARELAEDPFAEAGYAATKMNVVAAAAFEFRAKMRDGSMSRDVFTTMMREVNKVIGKYQKT